MKFRFGCRGCPACNMNRKHQHCNFKKLIFFPQERRKIKSLNLLVRPPPPCLLTLNNGWALSVLNTVWSSRPHTGIYANRICSKRWMAPLAVFTQRWPCLRTHTYGTLAWGNGWLLVQIYICHHCSPSFGINFITGTLAEVYYSVWQQVWGCMYIADSLSSWIRIYTVTHPFFRRA